MGQGNGHHQVKPAGGIQIPLVKGGNGNGNGQVDRDALPQTDARLPKHPKADAAVLFDKNWHKAQAEMRRSSLTTMIPGGENRAPVAHESVAHRQTERAGNLLNFSMDDLIALAVQHEDLKSFRHETREFWSEVKKMSEPRTIETYVNGKPVQRVASRYGDLLALLDRFVGGGGSSKDGNKNAGVNFTNNGRFEKFLSALSTAERSVFLARHQLNQTFGANELFAGRRGVALDKSGQFPLDVFLSSNGKNAQISAQQILSLLGGDLSGKEAATALLKGTGVLLNNQLLLNANSSALLGLSLALYQNINALLSLGELVPEAFLPKQASEPPVAFKQQQNLTAKNTFENAEIAATTARRAAGEQTAAGALINGALLTIEKYRKAKLSNVGLWADAARDDASFRFSAGATGAMMGATIGSVVPLAEKGCGEILGFASSVVVGLSDSGLRSLGANALVSVITSGVQSFLNVSSSAAEKTLLQERAPNNFLSAAEAASDFFEKDSRASLFSPRADALTTA